MSRDVASVRPRKHLTGWPAVAYSLSIAVAFVAWLLGGLALVANVLPWLLEGSGSQYRSVIAIITIWVAAFGLGRRVLLAVERYLTR